MSAECSPQKSEALAGREGSFGETGTSLGDSEDALGVPEGSFAD